MTKKSVFIRGALYLALLTLFSTGCATNPVTGKKELRLVSQAQEIQIGTQNYVRSQQSQGGDYLTHPGVNTYVQAVGKKLAAVSDRKELPYEFVVLNNAVPNAWALPGGKIAVNRGLLTELESEAELAAVLGHEIVHAAARHGAKNMERGMVLQAGVAGLGLAVADMDERDIILGAAGLSANLLTMKYSRGAELESDDYGMKYMHAAGYDPRAAIDLQETFVRLSEGRNSDWLSGLFASHPPSMKRVDANREHAKKYPEGGFIGRKEYERVIAPLRKNAPAYKKMEEGYKALKDNQPDRALALANEALKIEPKEAHFHGLAAKAHIVKKQYEPALKRLDRAIALNSNYFEFYLNQGRLKELLGDRRGAWAALEKSNALLPTASAHNALGLMAMKAGQTSRAIEHFKVASSSNNSAGEQSRQKLAELMLPSQPGKYLQVQYGLDANGYLVLAVKNHAPVTAVKVVLQVEYILPNGKPSRSNYPVAQLSSGEMKNLQTRIGRFNSPEELRSRVRARVVSASAGR